jgi:hypothetical protein
MEIRLPPFVIGVIFALPTSADAPDCNRTASSSHNLASWSASSDNVAAISSWCSRSIACRSCSLFGDATWAVTLTAAKAATIAKTFSVARIVCVTFSCFASGRARDKTVPARNRTERLERTSVQRVFTFSDERNSFTTQFTRFCSLLRRVPVLRVLKRRD